MKSINLKKIMQVSFILIIGIMIIPTICALFVLQVYKRQYDDIITNVSEANKISVIANENIPGELWEIVCGKKTFMSGAQFYMIHTIQGELEKMKNRALTDEDVELLEVASRTCTTLSKNIINLETQMDGGSSVIENQNSLDEIRTITALFADIMQDFIVSEIESANITNEAIKKSSQLITILESIIIIIALMVSVNAFITVAKCFGRPLSDMEKLSTEIAQGNLTARTNFPYVDELNPLAENMNLMAEQIQLLIQKNIEEQKNFQKAEMKALQAQITPHFLYNTFDTIIWLAEEEDTEKVVKITKAFSDFLRISLSRGHEWITIGQEISHISNYLTIQKIRYNDILNYEIIISPDLLNYKMIKLVLQPLVENAIYHGIKNKRGRGHLFIQVQYADETKNSIKFLVKDDGAGFTPERLEEVRKELETPSLESEKLNSVYGLYNVHKKLKLYYGDKTQGLKIVSEANKGATISFEIPIIMAGEENV